MSEHNLIERLDEAIDAVLAGRRDSHAANAARNLALAEPDLAMLLVVADELRDLPDPEFKARLRRDLIPQTEETNMTTALAYPSLMPYLVVNGAPALIDFLKNAFEAEERLRVPRPDGTIMHAEMIIGDSIVELADGNEQNRPIQVPLHLYVDDADAVYARAVRAGAKSLQAPVDQPYGDREAGVMDAWGNHWYISTHQEDVAEDEMMRRFEGRGSAPRRDPSVAPRPEYFHTVTVGLRAPGAERLIDFVTNGLGGTELHRTTMPDGLIIHAVMRIGDSVIELGEPHGKFEPMPVHLHLFVDDPDAIYARAVAAGATSISAPADTPYGQRMGGVRDASGNSWFLAKLL